MWINVERPENIGEKHEEFEDVLDVFSFEKVRF
jgi:hypothetical protein